MYALVKRRLAGVVAPRVFTRTLQQGTVLMAANLLGNLLQYLFHFFTSRMLGPVDYGILTTLLGLTMILLVPSGIAQTVITQYISGFFARSEMRQVMALYGDAMRKLSVAGWIAFGLLTLASPLIASFLNITSVWPVIAMASVLVFTGPITTILGTLQGLQRFYLVAGQALLGPGFRLAAGLLLVSAGLGASGALGATALSNLLVVLIGLVLLREFRGAASVSHGLTQGMVWQYGSLVFLGSLAFTILTNMDLVIVKHFFPSAEAGYYSAVSVLGKTVLYAPSAIPTLMFSKTSFRHALGQDASDLARKSLLVSAALCGLGCLVLSAFPALAVRLLFGSAYDASIPLVGLYGITMGLYAAVQLLLAFYISQEQARFAWLLIAVTVGLAIFFAFFHSSLVQIILALATGAILILVTSELWLGGLGLVKLVRATLK